ncbi:MAG: class I SAM-dependent methyltransferase [Thermoanaerobaculia bacterium]
MTDSSASPAAGSCGICGSDQFELLHVQPFILPGDIRTQYSVVACRTCGFTYARDLPSREQYEQYYRSNLKYTYQGSRDGAEALFQMHRPSFEMVDRHVEGKASRILDIGCATGELLALFERAGYSSLMGVDPTPECAAIAKKLYGLDVRSAVLSEFSSDPFDVVLLANVLEHVPNLAESLGQIVSVLQPGGFLFVQVPDAEHFGIDITEPFLEFSIEHINYFTTASLENLLGSFGIRLVEMVHDITRYKGATYPVITSLWLREGPAGRTIRPAPTEAIRNYIGRSKARLKQLSETIDAIVDSGDSVVIWGVGSLTARLLATTRLAEARIAGFVDSNSGQHGRLLVGKTISSPATLAGRSDGTVLIASFVYGKEIRATLEQELGYRGKIVTI